MSEVQALQVIHGTEVWVSETCCGDLGPQMGVQKWHGSRDDKMLWWPGPREQGAVAMQLW